MSSHIQFFKDQMQLFDQRLQELRQQIRDINADIAEIEQARLTTAKLMETVFGEPQTPTVVMQDMRMRAGVGYLDRRIEEAQQLAHGRGRLAIGALDDPTLPPLGSPERKREMDRRNYHKRQAKERQERQNMAAQGLVKKKDGTWGARERKERRDKHRPRNTAENRAANETIRTMIRNNVEHRVEPWSSGDLVRDLGYTKPEDRQRVYQAVSALYHKGELKQIGVSPTGFTYLRDGVANGSATPLAEGTNPGA